MCTINTLIYEDHGFLRIITTNTVLNSHTEVLEKIGMSITSIVQLLAKGQTTVTVGVEHLSYNP